MMIENAANHISIAILAGGRSRRMGRDKASLDLGGETWLERIIDAALEVSRSVVVVGRHGARDDIAWLQDEEPGLGPLGGLRTALAHLGRPVLLVGCDMPRVNADALGWLLDISEKSGAELGVATRRDGQIEPLFSVYRPAALERIDARMAAGRLSLRRLIDEGGFEIVEPSPAVRERLLNINTPEELAEFDGLGE
jgi:molybdopterin-guanine dinucleotide biosynthesis protein A